MSHTPDYFDAMFAGSDDPWQFKTRWYEERKRAITLAALPARRYRHGYEPGCANGVLSAALAARCDRLLVSDGAARAAALARERLAAVPNVEVIQAWVPAQWPCATFDLIVLSELGYFLSRADMTDLLNKAQQSLQPNGILLACHWRRQADDCDWSGDAVHQLMHAELRLPLVSTWFDADFRLEIWGGDARSVAEHEGLA